jgi:hypothetical protein
VFVTMETLLAGWLAKRPTVSATDETIAPAGRLT